MTTSPSIQRTNHRIISHELLTPVSHIVGYADILLEEANAQGNEQCVAALQRIFEAGHRLSELVDARMKAPGWAGTSADLASLDTELVQPLGQILSAGAELRLSPTLLTWIRSQARRNTCANGSATWRT